ncbi:unnamed protein product [Protopolystoma xenopodis]|uniref:Uncharacterized protein n=1 Tax=Protopolystoma xenopodis TaxID=117903 RepID=A0A448WHC2_9PLAT|nr:unnamed protein product [Protopolystoma xenopodis]
MDPEFDVYSPQLNDKRPMLYEKVFVYSTGPSMMGQTCRTESPYLSPFAMRVHILFGLFLFALSFALGHCYRPGHAPPPVHRLVGPSTARAVNSAGSSLTTGPVMHRSTGRSPDPFYWSVGQLFVFWSRVSCRRFKNWASIGLILKKIAYTGICFDNHPGHV